MKQHFFIIQFIVLLCLQNGWAQTKTDTIHVSHYDIHLEIRDFAQQEIRGYTDIYLEAKIAPLGRINLDFMTLTVDSIKYGEEPITFQHQGQQLKIDLPFSSVGEIKTIRVHYHGKPFKEQWGGFFFTSDYAYNIGVGMDSYPHAIGRVWFPCIDDFTDKSTYIFNIITDADKKAVCGGILIDSADYGDTKRWKWELTDPIPTYLASVAVGKFKSYKDTVHGINGIVPIEIYADSTTMTKVPGSFVNLKTFIHTYEKRWGPHRWQRVGYVLVPFSGGAMEHATNIAFPISYINGNTTHQSTIAHELAHSWFGNLITCSTSQNMWINEGFANYGEYLCKEILDPTLQTYKTEIKNLISSVVNKNVCWQYALDAVPPSHTYNSDLVYNKGAVVAYTLRNYMGDELFFSSIKQFFNENKYGNVDSEEFFDKLSVISGMNLHDFYLGWVHQPGFLNFNIDSIKPIANNKYQIAWKQRLHHAEYFADNNLVDVEFISTLGERYLAEKIRFSGEHDIVEIELPFEPAFWAIDPNFKMGDICYDNTHVINKIGNITDTYFKIQVNDIAGEAIIRVEYNPFAPTPPKGNPQNVLRVSEKRFWRIGFLAYSTMQAQYSFTYEQSYEQELLKGYTKDDLVLLYRKDAAHEWQIIPTTLSGGDQIGRLMTEILLPGEYTFGIGDHVSIKEWENNIKVYPNPTTGELRILMNNEQLIMNNVEIFDVYGRKISSNHLIPTSSNHLINISNLAAGIYFIRIDTDKGFINKKIIKH